MRKHNTSKNKQTNSHHNVQNVKTIKTTNFSKRCLHPRISGFTKSLKAYKEFEILRVRSKTKAHEQKRKKLFYMLQQNHTMIDIKEKKNILSLLEKSQILVHYRTTTIRFDLMSTK